MIRLNLLWMCPGMRKPLSCRTAALAASLAKTITGSHSAIEEGRDLSSMSGILADAAYRLQLA